MKKWFAAFFVVFLSLAATAVKAESPWSVRSYVFKNEENSRTPRLFAKEMLASAVRQARENKAKWENKPGTLGVNIWGASYHPDDKKNKMNEFNPGLGLRYYHNLSFFGEQWSSEANFILWNSQKVPTVAGCTSAAYPFFAMDGLRLYGGAAVCVIGSENRRADRMVWTGGIIPALMAQSERLKGWTLNFGAIPKRGERRNGDSAFEAFVFYLTYRW